ncbi:MAG: respiratory nitrate reductase subunit gamma [Bacteroidales bacterium]|nr:respiratory nitrate reductase subunit gamma [Bacteroidales bacterium]MCF8455920.1 respiratory nitrate reductase subunit gamma [Bacteroidales bacterium]
MNNFFFIGIPYAAFIIMLVGTIFRYTNYSFKYSSLSSQFLEGRVLHRGSRPFHWGVIALFFGHLIGFLFPSAVIAWNGEPVRLLIIEVSALAFALAFLYGLVILIIRRITNERVQVVTSKMDIYVYVVLVAQVITGIWIAYSYRWGSTWYASSMVPYLRSIFLLSPEIGAVVVLPLMVKIHIVTAFVFIGMIPFTRYVHFLVYPIRFAWRPMQVVIWNWDRKIIRNSAKGTKTVKSRNN